MKIMIVAVILLFSTHVYAASCGEIPFKTTGGDNFTTVDISGGAVTTAAFNTNGVEMLKLSIDIVDPTPGITDISLSFTESDTTSGTFRKVPFCQDSAPTLACGPLVVTWDPTADGLSWTIPIPWTYKNGKITVTPTGHGALDTVTLTAMGCQ